MSGSLTQAQYDHFRKLMIAARKSAGLTQVDVARNLNRPQSFVSKYERGERNLDVVEFITVAVAIGVDPTSIINAMTKDR